jgi:hypothetical protein
MISAQVSSAGATGEPTPFGDGDAEPRAGLDVDVRADAAGLGDQLELRKLLEELARKLAALADQDQHSASRTRTESWPSPLTVFVKTLVLRCSRIDAHLSLRTASW